MAKKSKRSHGKKFTLPVAVVAGIMPVAYQGLKGFQQDGVEGLIKRTTLSLTGYNVEDHKFYTDNLKEGLYPMIIGMLVHWGAKKFGINRALGAAGIPVIRV